MVTIKERGYQLDTHERFLLIPIHKNASSSVMKAAKPLGRELTHDEALTYNHLPTIATIRHPWDRLVSALFTNLMDARPFAERLEDHVLGKAPENMNSHVRPQWFWLRGLRVDYWLRLPHLNEDWALMQKRFPHFTDLGHLKRGPTRPDGWDGLYDWRRLLPLYRKDFELCPDW